MTQKERLALASAVATWLLEQGTWAIRLQEKPLSRAEFDNWLRYWMLGRFMPASHILISRTFLNLPSTRGRLLKCPARAAEMGRLVSELVGALGEKCRRRYTSMVSKYAHTLRPEVFTPYDRRAKQALRNAGFRCPDHDYTAFCEGFAKRKSELRKDLRTRGIGTSEICQIKNDAVRAARECGLKLDPRVVKELSASLIWSRFTDKLLMLEGGFSEELMAKDWPCR